MWKLKRLIFCVTKYCVAWCAGHWWRGCCPCPRTSAASVTQDQGSGSVASSAPGLGCNNTVVSKELHYYEHYSLVMLASRIISYQLTLCKNVLLVLILLLWPQTQLKKLKYPFFANNIFMVG